MTDPTPDPCDWQTLGTPGTGAGAGACGQPATTYVVPGDDLPGSDRRAVCDLHHGPAIDAGYVTSGSTGYTPPADLTGPGDSVLRRRDAIVRASRDAKGTADAKAAHIHDQLEADGWQLLHYDDGAPVSLRGDQQVVTVPDGYVVDVHPAGSVYFTAPETGDHELDLMNAVRLQLGHMGPDAAERVARWVTDRFTAPDWVDMTPPNGLTLSVGHVSPAGLSPSGGPGPSAAIEAAMRRHGPT